MDAPRPAGGHRAARRGAASRQTTPRLIARLTPSTPSPYHRLNPLTKVVAAIVESVGAFVVGGFVGPLLIIGLAILPGASIAGVARRLVRISFLLTLPIAISVVLVSVFTRAGTHVLFTIGPFDATTEGSTSPARSSSACSRSRRRSACSG